MLFHRPCSLLSQGRMPGSILCQWFPPTNNSYGYRGRRLQAQWTEWPGGFGDDVWRPSGWFRDSIPVSKGFWDLFEGTLFMAWNQSLLSCGQASIDKTMCQPWATFAFFGSSKRQSQQPRPTLAALRQRLYPRPDAFLAKRSRVKRRKSRLRGGAAVQ